MKNKRRLDIPLAQQLASCLQYLLSSSECLILQFAAFRTQRQNNSAAVLIGPATLDQACVEALLRKPSAYLGVIGSRRKAERFKMRLTAAGFTEAELSRVHSPMGVAINALTPAEIAVSIVGELIQLRRKDAKRK